MLSKKDIQLCKKKILKCLTENFEYGKTKSGKPLKRPRVNQALFSAEVGYQVFNNTNLEMVMDAVVRGLYFAMEDSKENK